MRTLVAFLLLTNSVSAYVAVFDNSDGIFEWRPSEEWWSRYYETTPLDITKGRYQGYTTTEIELFRDAIVDEWSVHSNYLLDVVIDTTPVPIKLPVDGIAWLNFPKAFELGDTIGPDMDYGKGTLTAGTSFGVDHVDVGAEITVGVRIQKAGKTHYGWIHLVDTQSYYQPTRWAYETEPNTPVKVIVPEPSTWCLLLLGVAACARLR